jgi:hypothetical protein
MSPRISGVWQAPTRRWGVKVLSAILARLDSQLRDHLEDLEVPGVGIEPARAF